MHGQHVGAGRVDEINLNIFIDVCINMASHTGQKYSEIEITY
jgi:hypothetical protein